MRTMMRLLTLDLRKGFKACWKKMVFALAVLLALALLSVFCYKGTSTPSLGDSFVYLLTGINFFEPDPQRSIPFTVPNVFLLIFLLCSYVTLEYPFEDLEGQGELSVLVCGSRAKWWLSKCLWVILMTAVFFMFIGVALVLATLMSQGNLGLEVHSEAIGNTGEYSSDLIEGPWNLLPLLTCMFLSACTINLLQLFGSLLVKPLPAFGMVAVLYILSAYFSNPLLLGEYLMSARSSVFITSGVSPYFGAALAVALGIWATVFSTLYFKQSDLMSRGES